ncbi:MAG: HU family DNA-binding protein [Oscillospiraceae bacterium]|nr:HU family DNA-binding protein [Oscillospiraceae bacterium]
MNKSELITAVAEKSGVSKKDSEAAVNAAIASITDALKSGDKVQLVGFGTFEVREHAAKNGVNPQTKAKITIPARKVPAFKPGKALKDAVEA